MGVFGLVKGHQTYQAMKTMHHGSKVGKRTRKVMMMLNFESEDENAKVGNFADLAKVVFRGVKLFLVGPKLYRSRV